MHSRADDLHAAEHHIHCHIGERFTEHLAGEDEPVCGGLSDAFEDPLVQRIRTDVTPAWMTRKVPAVKAGKVVIEAIEKRQPRAIAPAEWKALFYGRGIFGPMFDKRIDEDQAIAQIVPEAEQRQRG